MPDIEIVTLNFQHTHLLHKISLPLSRLLQHNLTLRTEDENLDKFYNSERAQYDADQILQLYEHRINGDRGIIFTSVDIFIPIFTHVFGLAKLNGRVAIVSSLRLSNEYYGLPKDDTTLQTRLMKEAVHEFGHLCNLRHCHNYLCVMASSTTADELDTKKANFCDVCASVYNQCF
jgi:archaemetzincin